MKQGPIQFEGLDVHQSTIVASVRDESGKVVMNATIATEGKAIIALVRSWPRVHVAFEEGTQALWLHDVLTEYVERVVVCNVRGRVRSRTRTIYELGGGLARKVEPEYGHYYRVTPRPEN